MSASQIKKDTLKQLHAARMAMMSARLMLALDKQGKKTRALAANELMSVNHAIQRLKNEQLPNIRDKLLQNEAALARGANRLNGALKNLNEVKPVLRAVSSLLLIVGRVVSMMVAPHGPKAGPDEPKGGPDPPKRRP